MFQNTEISVFTTNIQHTYSEYGKFPYIYVYDNENLVPFRS